MYVAIEGIDGSGTTTQAKAVADALKGKSILTQEPTRFGTGALIREYLKLGENISCLPYLFAADRAVHLDSVVGPALARDLHVISDRCIASSLAYQGSEYGLFDVVRLNKTFRLPHIIVFLEIETEEALKRITSRGREADYYEQAERLESVRSHYETALGYLAGRQVQVLRLDATLPPAEITHKILSFMGKS